MKTEQLIDLLARGTEAAPKPRWGRRLTLMLAAGLVAAVLLVAASGQMRPDIGTAPMPVMLKALFSAAAAAAIMPLALQLMKPGRPLGWRLGAIGVFVAICVMAAAIALMGEAPDQRMLAWMGGGFPWCLVLVPLLAAPAAALLLWLMRDFAPTRLGLAGASIGALSGGIGAMAYAMYCPVDLVAFVVTWYVVAIALCAALGAVLGSKLLRW